MKLILEKWKAYTQSCTDSDGDKGVAVVKKSGSDKIESCHASKDKAEDAVKARYANYKNESVDDEDVIEEISTMSGGNVQGYAGSAIGDIDTVKKFNKEEEEASKLKGKRLAEMFSTSTQTGGVPQSKVKPEDEHEGHVKRSKHQGLKNVMEADDDTQPMQGGSDNFAMANQGTVWKLADFADNTRNASRVFDVLRDVEKNIGMEKLQKAIISDSSAESRVNVMSTKFGYASDLLEKIKNNNEESIKKYYQFLINEFLFWSTYNPMASAQQYAGRKGLLSKPMKDLAYSHVFRYVRNPSVNNPKSLGQRIKSQASDYKLDPDLDPALYELPEE